ncbi:MAG: hypothetical protein J7M24_00115 [Candidatus Latescibacteria bacterium]|nr:hypothetical protein [Candidatus Latescibacterota bacterium]
MAGYSRRGMLKAGMLAGAGAAAGGAGADASCGAGPVVGSGGRWDAEYDFGHRILFMDEYLQGTLNILGCLRGEIGHIVELSARAAGVIRSGGTVWSSANIGHMPAREQAEDRRGNPGVIKSHTSRSKVRNLAEMAEATFDEVKKGDMIFTCYCNRSLQQARDRGAYVVSVPVNYVNNEFYPEGYVLPNEDNLMLGDVSNEVLHSYIPYEQGLVHPPEIPYMAICPSCVTALGSIHWMLSAEIANRLGGGKAAPAEKAAAFMDILEERIRAVGENHSGRIRETAVEMSHRILDGGRWFVRSIEHTGFQSELVRVASGPWMPNTGDWNLKKQRNVFLVTGISPAYPEEVSAALEKQVEGAFVIGIGPASLDGVVPPGRLIDVADAGFDNYSPESGGVLDLPGREGTFCPTSGIVGNVIQQMICAQWADEMARRGAIPYFLLGNYRGGRNFNPLLKPSAEARGF